MKKIALLAFALAFILNAANAQNALAIPDTISGNIINLQIQNGTRQFYNGAATQTMGINGNMLAPTIILYKHQNVTMHVTNNLNDTTTIHWHGMHVAPQNDGGPHITILPGKTWSPSMEVIDHASTHWYHPHLHMKTYDHVQKGIAGFIIVRDSDEAAINLPRTYGIDDFPLAIQTKGIDANNQIVTMHTVLDTALMVNGTLKPVLSAPAQMVRFRVLNGSPERVYNLGFTSNKTFYQIGSDGGLLSAPVALTRLLLAPGERAEILVNLADVVGGSLQLINYGTEIPSARYGAAQPGMGAGQVIPNYALNPLNGANFTILEIKITAQTSNAVTTVPSSLITHNPWIATSAQTTRSFVFTSMGMGQASINGPFVINGSHFDMSMVNFQVPFNNIEIWELRNQTPIAHPFHIHNVQFYILDINGAAPPLNMRGRKDVVLVPGGNSTVRFITKFEDFHNDTLPYMYHCHMISHEDDGMMGQFVVKSPCYLISAPPSNQSALPGANVQFSVAVSDTNGTSYQWQSNVGFGFQDLQNVAQYAGVNTKTLLISAVNSANNNQQFRCKVANQTCEVTSDMAVLQVGVNGIANANQNIQVQVFPNPAKDLLFVQLFSSVRTKYVLHNLMGEVVQEGQLPQGQNSIDISLLKTGIYHVLLWQNEQIMQAKFVKE